MSTKQTDEELLKRAEELKREARRIVLSIYIYC